MLIFFYEGKIYPFSEAKAQELEGQLISEQGLGYLWKTQSRKLIDAELDRKSPAKYLNHSCEVSFVVQVVILLILLQPNTSSVEIGGKPAIYSLVSIKKGDELTLDYTMKAAKKAKEQIPCHCGMTTCKKFLNPIKS